MKLCERLGIILGESDPRLLDKILLRNPSIVCRDLGKKIKLILKDKGEVQLGDSYLVYEEYETYWQMFLNEPKKVDLVGENEFYKESLLKAFGYLDRRMDLYLPKLKFEHIKMIG